MQTAQQLKFNDYNALLADHCELADLVAKQDQRIAAQDARISQLEYLLSEEIMRGLAKPSGLREIVVDERQPANIPGATAQTTTVEDIDRQMTGVR